MTTVLDITVAGSFGFGNAGDEAVPLALADLLDGCTPTVRFVPLARYSEPDDAHVIGLGLKDRQRREALANQPLLYAGGGVVEPRMQSVLLRVHQAMRAHPPSAHALFGANVEAGVRFSWRWRRRIRRTLDDAVALCVRDVVSRDALKAIMPGRDIRIIGDVVLAMRPSIARPSVMAGCGRYIAVTLAPRWSDSPAWSSWIAPQLVRLARQMDAAIIFVPMSVHHDDDRVEHGRVAQMMRRIDHELEILELLDEYCPRTLSAIFAGSMLTVGMRLHTCVMAVSNNVPTLMLAYHPKVTGFARTVGLQEYCVPSGDPTSQHREAYGYRFEDTGLSGVDLRDKAHDAMSNASFRLVDDLRLTMRQALIEALDAAGVSITMPNVMEMSA